MCVCVCVCVCVCERERERERETQHMSDCIPGGMYLLSTSGTTIPSSVW